MKVDVFIPTYNSEKYLSMCLSSVIRSIPVNKLIIIDNYSTDGTERIARQYGCEIIKDANGLAAARMISFKLASTELFVTVESDIVYEQSDWFESAVSLLKGRTAAVVAFVPRDEMNERGQYFSLLSKYTPLRKAHGFSAGSTIWLRDAVAGVRIPVELRAYEDVYIERVLRRNGWNYRWIEVKGKHYSSFEERKARWYGANARIFYRYTGDISLLRRNVTLPAKAFIVSILGMRPRLIPWSLRFAFNYMVGWSMPWKYSVLKR